MAPSSLFLNSTEHVEKRGGAVPGEAERFESVEVESERRYARADDQ